jgi:hypothetical protein
MEAQNCSGCGKPIFYGQRALNSIVDSKVWHEGCAPPPQTPSYDLDEQSACRGTAILAADPEYESMKLDARRLRFCVRYGCWPRRAEISPLHWVVKMHDLSTDEISEFTCTDPLKCIDLAMRSVG